MQSAETACWSYNTYLGVVGLSKDSDHIIDVSFDILSLEAIFLVPRVCSLLSLVPYFGSLVSRRPEYGSKYAKLIRQLQIPCLKAMVKTAKCNSAIRFGEADIYPCVRRKIL